MTHKTKFIQAIIALIMLSASPAGAFEQKASIQAPVPFDPGVRHADGADLFWVNQEDGAKGIKKVIIPFFQIQFVTEEKASASGAGGAHSRTATQLSGPTAEQMQAVTDEVYAAFVADLQADGLEVVPMDQARGYAAYNEIMAAAKPSGEAVNGMNGVTSRFFAPTGMNFYYLPTGLPDLAGGGTMTAVGNAPIIRKEADLMTQSGAAVIGFRAVVDFATLSASDRRGFRALARNAKTSAEFGLVIKPVSTQVFLLTPNAKGTMMDPHNRMRIELQSPLMIESDAIQSTDENSTKAAKRGEAIGNAIGMLSGIGGYSNKSQSFAVVVDPAIWQRDVTGALKGVSSAATARLKAGL